MSIRSVVVACVLLSCGAPSLSWSATTEATSLSDEQIAFFESQIRPVLVRECYGCHSHKSGKVRGGLTLDTKEATLLGGDSGPAIVPGDLDESLLWSSINYESYEMPPSGKLHGSVIAKFKQWIEMGAPDPRDTTKLKLNSTITAEDIEKAKSQFWAYQQVAPQTPPEIDSPSWPKSDIDRFVLAELEAASMQPADDVDPYTLLKRLTFDLTGLPPSLEQIEYFLNMWESDPDRAVEHVVDHLLDSERFGERWGRHWLDVARYAESSGKEINLTYPHAWRYRDYVIDSFNEDKPFNRFLVEQIAGDMLPVKSDEQWSENLVATTFLAIGPKTLSEQNGRQFDADLADEQIDVTTRVFLGTSVACARCHDHKFDPIPQTDYYAMVGIFQNMTTHYGTINSRRNRRPSDALLLPTFDEQSVAKAMDKEELQRLQQQLAETVEEERRVQRLRQQVVRRGESGPNLPDKDDPSISIRAVARLARQVSDLRARLATVDQDGQPVGKAMGVQAKANPRDATVYIRGELDKPSDTVPRGVPQVLTDQPLSISGNSSGRLELAHWMASSEHPLTARVMANRVWKHLLGQGIVSSTENFGSTGQPPSHPELLDHLAHQFVESDWSVKSLIREIVTSRIYRIDSAYNSAYFESDPENRLLWRVAPRRLDAEVIRDAMLFVSDEIELDRPIASLIAKVGNATVNGDQVFIESELGGESTEMMTGRSGTRTRARRFAGAGQGGTTMFARFFGRGANRVSLDVSHENYRSVFMPIVRDFTPRSLEVFDFPDASMVVGQRYESNTANQALYMLNNPLVLRSSEALAGRVAQDSSDRQEQIESIFLQVYGRPASKEELEATQSFLRERNRQGGRSSRQETLSLICQSLFASAEFRYQY